MSGGKRLGRRSVTVLLVSGIALLVVASITLVFALPVLHYRVLGTTLDVFLGEYIPPITRLNTCQSPCILDATITLGHYDKWEWDFDFKAGQEISITTQGESQIFTEFSPLTDNAQYKPGGGIQILKSGIYTLRIHYDNSERTELRVIVTEIRN